MSSPVVHFEIRSSDPDATRSFFGKLFGWTFPEGGIPGYSYVDTGVEGAIPGGISPLQDGAPLVTFFVGVQDVAATLDAAVAQGGKVIQSRQPAGQAGPDRAGGLRASRCARSHPRAARPGADLGRAS